MNRRFFLTRQIVWILVASLLLGFGELLARDVTGSLPGIDATRNVGSAAEWEQAESILMHTPGDELFLGVIHPDAALFEKPFSIDQAAAEHRQYIRTLEDRGVKVSTVVGTLLEGTLDDDGKIIEGAPLVHLRDFAKSFITFDTTELSVEEQHEQESYLNKVIDGLHPNELVRIILEKPDVHLKKSETNTGYVATYSLRPVMNLYFTRDQVITTGKGVVVNKMQSQQRASEIEIIRFVLQKLGITPIAEIEGEGRLEGGDFIPAGDVVFIGQGLRTNAEAIRQLLDQDVFGAKTVVVVKDHWQNQVQMHLDTFFNIINKNLAVLVDTRVRSEGYTPDEQMRLTVDIYEQQADGQYLLAASDLDFQDYLTDTLEMQLIPVPNEDQLKYGVNFLTVSADNIIAVDGVSEGYKEQLRHAGVNATWIDFSNMTGGYGAAHCVTQVLKRQP